MDQERQQPARPTTNSKDGVRRLLVKQYNAVYALTDGEGPGVQEYLASLAAALDSHKD